MSMRFYCVWSTLLLQFELQRRDTLIRFTAGIARKRARLQWNPNRDLLHANLPRGQFAIGFAMAIYCTCVRGVRQDL